MYEVAVIPAVTQIRRRGVEITTVTFAFHCDEIYLRVCAPASTCRRAATTAATTRGSMAASER